MYNHQQRFMTSAGGGSSRPRGALSNQNATAAGALGALADWAARSLDPEISTSPIQVQVERCCDPSNREPNLALNLELADYVKQKKANAPREAAVEVVKRVNSRHPHVSILALHLLDHLVKNCGYPFHLQIATKEFLNELVKRFPERPPVFPSPTQSKILELIHEWKQTICMTSKQKEDLVHIRDMHRLLGYKGYRFPNVDARAASVMNVEGNSLQSPEELEEEDREAQGAKLQELIRRGTPKDLAQAQELMKIMSGAEPESKPDYSQRTRKELDKVQSRAVLLNNMLDNASEQEKFARGDAYDQIASQLRGVQPRVQKMIGDAEEAESEHLDRLLLVNDLINQVIERYQAYKKGDFSVKVTIDPSIDPSKGGADAVPTPKVTDLISFDDEPSTSATGSANADSGTATGSSNMMDDFASLTFDGSNGSASANAASKSSSGLPIDLFSSSNLSKPASGTNGNGVLNSTSPSGSDTNLAFGQWGALQLPMGGSGSGTSTPSKGTPQGQAQSGATLSSLQGSGQQQQVPPKATSSDPFADLSKW